jgi:endonuclease YncB( thermonuclease family)
MARKKKKSTLIVVLTLVVVSGAWYINNKDDLGLNMATASAAEISSAENKKLGVDTARGSKENANFKNNALPDKLKDGLTEVKFKSKEFDVLKNSSLVNHRNNDGDSFHVKHGGKETEFRLYFVDAAESKFKKYRDGNDNGDRIRDQGKYFGGLEMRVTTKMGMVAKSFVTDLLSKQHFTIVTKWENVFTPERKYCYLIVKWEDKEVYLHELLVAKGLVRIKTRGASLPDNTNFHDQKKKLQKMEQQAKTAKLGAWGIKN